MSKKTLIIILAIIAIGILVVVVAGRTATQVEEPIVIEDDTLMDQVFDNEMIEFDEEIMIETETEVEVDVTEETITEEELTE